MGHPSRLPEKLLFRELPEELVSLGSFVSQPFSNFSSKCKLLLGLATEGVTGFLEGRRAFIV